MRGTVGDWCEQGNRTAGRVWGKDISKKMRNLTYSQFRLAENTRPRYGYINANNKPVKIKLSGKYLGFLRSEKNWIWFICLQQIQGI